jgi:hypothetical protein
MVTSVINQINGAVVVLIVATESAAVSSQAPNKDHALIFSVPLFMLTVPCRVIVLRDAKVAVHLIERFVLLLKFTVPPL